MARGALWVWAGIAACAPEGEVRLRSGGVGPSEVEPGPAVVAFGRPLREADRAALRAAGLAPIAPIGQAWVVVAPDRALPRIPGAIWAGTLPPRARVAPELAAGDGPLTGVAELLPGADAAAIAAALRERGLPAHAQGRRIVSRLADGPQRDTWIEALSERPDVLWLSRRGRRVLLDAVNAQVAQSGIAGDTTPLFDAGIDGTGQIAAILDTGIDIDHCMFVDPTAPPALNDALGTATAPGARKVIAVDFLYAADDPADPFAWDDHLHGTHVAGVLAGDEGADGLLDPFDGMAPSAKLVIQDGGFGVDACSDLAALGCPVGDLVGLFEQAYAQGARVHNDSWGDREDAPDAIYSDGSVDADQESWDRPDYLLVFAAGNDGVADRVLSPSNAKNTLSVGAVRSYRDADQVASFSSGGPTDDGRIKPDLVFPGEYVLSAANDFDVGTGNCDAWALSGTSLAAPGISGLALLVRQYFEDGWSPSGAPVAADGWSPSSALVKAALVASAQPVSGPLAFTGFGRPQLDLVLPLSPGSARTLLALDEAHNPSFGGGEPAEVRNVTVEDGSQSLRIALVWRDPPSNPLAARHLVNDLDLTVSGPDGSVWHGNVFDGFWSAPDTGSENRVDNVELVRIESPSPGSWRIEVAPYAVAIGPQPFALVVSGAFAVDVPQDTGATPDTATSPDTLDTAPPDTETTEPEPDRPDTGSKGDEGGCGCASSTASPSIALPALGLIVRRRSGVRERAGAHLRALFSLLKRFVRSRGRLKVDGPRSDG